MTETIYYYICTYPETGFVNPSISNKIMSHLCNQCPLRAKHDRKPKSIIGCFWRWHINFCPGWKAYFTSLSKEEQQTLRDKYNFQKYQ